MIPNIETVSFRNGGVTCPNPDCALTIRVAKCRDAVYRRTRGCHHLVAVRACGDKFEADFYLEAPDE